MRIAAKHTRHPSHHLDGPRITPNLRDVYPLSRTLIPYVTVLNHQTLRNRTPDDGLGQSETCRE
jgi:hypothetical protein